MLMTLVTMIVRMIITIIMIGADNNDDDDSNDNNNDDYCTHHHLAIMVMSAMSTSTRLQTPTNKRSKMAKMMMKLMMTVMMMLTLLLTGQLRSPLQDVVDILHHDTLYVVQFSVDVVQVPTRPTVHERLLRLLDVRVCGRGKG